MVGIIRGSDSSIALMQQPLQQYIEEVMLQGLEPTRPNLSTGLTNAVDDSFQELVSCHSLIFFKKVFQLSRVYSMKKL